MRVFEGQSEGKGAVGLSRSHEMECMGCQVETTMWELGSAASPPSDNRIFSLHLKNPVFLQMTRQWGDHCKMIRMVSFPLQGEIIFCIWELKICLLPTFTEIR
jgi:hypothetical protein